MKDDRKTKKQLIGELTKLRSRVAGLEGSKSDITKVKRSEDETRRQHRMMQNTVESLTHPFYVIDAHNYTIEFANSASGVKDCHEGQTCYALTHGLDRPCQEEDLVCPLEEAKRTGLPSVVEHTFSDGEGNARIYDVCCYPILDDDGNVAQVIAYHIDITQRKQAEEALRQTVAEREKLEAIINRSRAMVFLWRLQEGWPVEYVSDNVKDVLGYTAEDLLSGRISWPGITHPDDLLEIEAEVEKFLEEGVDEFTHEYRVTSKAGEIRWMRDRNQVLRDPDGTATHMQSILTDITKYKLAEKELRDMHGIVNRSSIVAYMCKADEDWTTEFISDNVHEVLGYSPEDFYSERVRYSEIVHPDDFQRAKAEYEKLAQDNEPDEINIEYRLKTGSGEEIWIEDRSWAIRDANGKVAYVQGVDVDITERKQAEEEIESKSRTNQTILDAFPCVALLLRPQTREIVASNKMAVEVGAIPGKTCFETWFQRETPCPWCLAQKVWSDGKAQHCEPTSMGVTWDVYWIPVSDDIYMHFAFDITERKKTENALKESEEKYRQLFETETDAIMVFDAETRQFVDVNDAAVHLYGYSRDELLKMKQDDITAEPEDSDVSIKLTLAGAVTRVPVRYHKKKDGTVFPVEISASSFTMKGRKVLCGVIRDITERKQAEQALTESEAKYRQLFSTETDAILVFDAEELDIFDVNEATIDLYGYSRDEFLNLKITDISAEVEKTIDCISRVRDGDMSRIPIRHHKKKDGTVFPVEISPGCFTLDNRKVFCGIYRDITERKQAEEALTESEDRYRSLVERAQDVIYTISAEGKITSLNSAFETVTGWPCDQWIGRPVDELLHPDDVAKSTEIFERVLQGENPPVHELRIRTKSGEYLTGEFRETVIRHDGDLVQILGIARDITERKQVEEELSKERALLKAIIDNVPVLLTRYAPDTKMLYLNKEFEKIVGWTTEEVKDIDLMEKVYPDPDYRKQAMEYMQKASTEWREFRVQSKSGKIVESEWSNLRLDDGTQIGIGIDITERKKAEEELENIFSLSPDMVGVFTTDGKLLRVNPSWEKVLGYTPEELLDMDWTELVHPDDVERTNEEVEKQLKGSPVVNFVNRYKCKDGSYRSLEWQATFAVEGVVHATARDITERKQAEEALRASEEKHRSLTESVGIGITMISPQMEVLSINNQLKQWFPDVDISKRPLCYKVFKDPPRDEICSYCPTAKVLKDGQVHEAETEASVGDEIRKYRIISSPVRDADGRVVAVIEGVEDITDRVRLEDEMHKADKLESVGVLAGGIAHDFNNIMTAVFGNISLAKMEVEPDSEIEELLSEAEMAATRAKDLTHQLLTFSKGGSPVKETASIEKIIRDSSSFVLHGANVKCELSLDDDLRGVEVDVGQMSQVISNLVINADQAMPDGGVVAINAENVSVGRKDPIPLKSGKYIKITIEDQGIGINEEHLGKIFDPFFTTKQKGSGLGLATTYSIIKRHDGHIEVASEIGVGTVFRIYLPATKKKKTQTAKGIGDESLIGTGRILIMDDEELVRKTAGMTLKRLGYEVDFASDGAEALVKYHQAMKTDQPFDAVILDLTVPGGMGGQECIKRLKALDPAVKAIVSSGYSNDLVVSNFSEYGFCGTANKPYKAKELGRAMQEMLTAE